MFDPNEKLIKIHFWRYWHKLFIKIKANIHLNGTFVPG